MALFQTKPKPAQHTTSCDNDVASKIQQRRYQILVHSLLYYELDTNLVSDSQWSAWAVELAKLQKQYPEIADKVIFAEAFKTFDGSSGFDLPYRDEQIVNIAYRLLRLQQPDMAESIHRVIPISAEYKGFYDKHPVKEPKKITQRKVVNKVEPNKRKKLF